MTTTRNPGPIRQAMWSKVLPSCRTAGAMASGMDAKYVDASLFVDEERLLPNDRTDSTCGSNGTSARWGYPTMTSHGNKIACPTGKPGH